MSFLTNAVGTLFFVVLFILFVFFFLVGRAELLVFFAAALGDIFFCRFLSPFLDEVLTGYSFRSEIQSCLKSRPYRAPLLSVSPFRGTRFPI